MKNFNRTQYLNNKCTHAEYYGQFVTEELAKTVKNVFSEETLINAFKTDEHFNSIPLKQWDNISYLVLNNHHIRSLLKECNDSMTLSSAVCILKRAALTVVTQKTEN